MKAACRSKYGTGKVLTIKEVDTPVPKENEVLIKVYATTVNRSDSHVLTGKPYFQRLFTGVFKPRLATTGCDFAGQIESVGRNVTSFKVGDKVMGFVGVFTCGTHAEYVAFPEARGIVKMPANASYEQAAACCEATFYAASLFNKIKLKTGQKALVYGATGGIGSAYLHFLKLYGLYVTAVCRGDHEQLVMSWGADRVIDYTKKDFTKDTEKYDYVFDAVGKSTFLKCKPLLTQNGTYIPSDGLANAFWGPFTSLVGGKQVLMPIPRNIKGTLEFIKNLVEQKKFMPVIDRVYPFDKISDAFDYVALKQKVGNVVILISE